jgi:isopenicillin N synthase-like dioxygenase
MPLDREEALADQAGIDQTEEIASDALPLIDVSGLIDGSREADVARQMADAFRTFGFCYIKGHGIPQEKIDRAFKALPLFFDLPESEKEKVPANRNQRGFIGRKKSTAAHGKKPNLTESFIIGLDLPESDPDRKAGIPLHDTNRWPEGIPEFREALESYWRELYALGPKMMRGLALAMGLDGDFFVPMFQKPDSLLRCAMYPRSESENFDGGFGFAPHTDNGTLTILAQDNVGGLQLRALGGGWINAPSIPGTFVINVGDMVMRLTNGAFRSTPHRVTSSQNKTRYSMPFFYFPDYSAEIKVLPQFTTPDNPPKYDPVIWGEYVMDRFSKGYEHFQKKG